MANPDPGQETAAPAAHVARPEALALEEIDAHLHRGRADLAMERIAGLDRALRGSDHVRLFAMQAVVIGFACPLERSAATPVPRDPPALSSLDLVWFHVDLPRAPSGLHQAIDYGAVLALSFEAGAIKAPQARRILITDETTQLPADLRVDEVMRFPLDRGQLMYERMRLQSLYLKRRAPGRCSVLMDSDMVVNADPSRVFGEAFDIGLTWRGKHADAPFNGGLILVAEGAAGLDFFGKVRACYDALAADATVTGACETNPRAWWGDQWALAATVGYRAYGERTTDVLSVDGIRVRLFPCETHNFTPEPQTRYDVADLRRKFFIHFKGNRKQMLAFYLGQLRSGHI